MKRDAWAVGAVALALRLGIVAWAARAIPATADGQYYDKLAHRIAEGHGYTWLWPDGAVTYAAHFPVGYPALLAAGYALFGASPIVAMIVNALIGAASAVAVRSLVPGRLGVFAGLALALHPALVPYTAAIMTEGITAALLVIATAFAASARGARRPWLRLVATGLVLGFATLVRPQSLVFAPVLGALAIERRLLGAALVTGVMLAVTAPWTARNCVRMEKCALVSVNGGWNLAIGAQTDNGGWQEIRVPEACKTVFQEAAKDTCFGAEARKEIERNPLSWLARIPKKLRMTFDYFGAAPWYLHAANPERFPYQAKVTLGAIETFVCRALLAAALVAILRCRSIDRRAPRDVARAVSIGIGLVACVVVPGTIAYLALACAIVTLGFRTLRELPLVVPVTAVVVLATAATHAVFFGAGRYGLVVVPFVTAVAFVRLAHSAQPKHGAPVDVGQAIAGLDERREESPSSKGHDAG